MKKALLYIGIAITAAFSSCDYVSNVLEAGQDAGGGSSENPIDSSVIDTVILRKVLIEDYTGHKCGNCPAAAEELHRIDSVYEGKIIPLAVHAGGFANTNPVYPTDLRTPDGDTYDTDFNISFTGNPNGLVNRKGHGTSDFILGWTLWETYATPAIDDTADFKIVISNTYTPGTRNLTAAVKVTATHDVSGIYNVSVLIVEDSIIAEQLDYRLPSGQQKIPDYNFMHVLRGSLNTTWGAQVLNGSWTIGRNLTKTYNYTLPAQLVPEHCHILAFVYNADNTSTSYYEVRQVEKAEIIP